MVDPAPKPLVSVVTPVYNGDEYLTECIESVLAQTYENWQYTIVDNCSTDRTLEIARAYAARDPRIRVESNQTVLPQLANFNKAMSFISEQSRYGKMVMADDWMFPDCLDEMVALAEEHPSVGIVSAYRLDDRRVTCDGLPYPSPVSPGRDISRASLLEDLFVFGSPTTLLYRGEIVRQRVPFFDESSLHADTEACYEILMNHDLGFVHKVLTFTRRENESLTSERARIDPGHFLDKLIVTLKYGPRLLEGMEYEDCLRRAERRYYRFLGDRSMYKTGPEFWAYHRQGLQNVGHSLERRKLIASWIAAAAREVGNPARLMKRIRRRVGRTMKTGHDP